MSAVEVGDLVEWDSFPAGTIEAGTVAEITVMAGTPVAVIDPLHTSFLAHVTVESLHQLGGQR